MPCRGRSFLCLHPCQVDFGPDRKQLQGPACPDPPLFVDPAESSWLQVYAQLCVRGAAAPPGHTVGRGT